MSKSDVRGFHNAPWENQLPPWVVVQGTGQRHPAEVCLDAVQVIWRLDSGARTFLPRLQGALTGITPAPSDAACYVVTQADNTIRMVGTHLCQALNTSDAPHPLPALHDM